MIIKFIAKDTHTLTKIVDTEDYSLLISKIKTWRNCISASGSTGLSHVYSSQESTKRIDNML